MSEPRSTDTTEYEGPILAAHRVSIRRGANVVCHDVDVDIGKGECLGIIGPNGSGKTTLLSGLRGLLPFSGRLSLCGRPLSEYSRLDIARRIAVVPQRLEFTVPYRVDQMVALGRAPYRRPWQGYSASDRKRIHEVLEQLGIVQLADAAVDRISGGERRKVFLARALVQDTEILFLDEPLAGLDPAAQERLLAQLAELRATTGTTIVVVAHDLRFAQRFCDRVIGLQRGRPRFLGRPDDVLTATSLEALYGVPWAEYRGPSGAPLFLPTAAPGPLSNPSG